MFGLYKRLCLAYINVYVWKSHGFSIQTVGNYDFERPSNDRRFSTYAPKGEGSQMNAYAILKVSPTKCVQGIGETPFILAFVL